MSSITSLSVQQLRKAAALKEKIQSLEKELNQLLGSPVASVASAAPKTKKKFTMSAAAKAKISAAAKLRWAKVRASKAAAKPASKPVVKKAKGKMSAAAKAKLSAKMKALWAARKAAKK
jgi:murein L,D-transpeptidase YcbB/YkuD